MAAAGSRFLAPALPTLGDYTCPDVLVAAFAFWHRCSVKTVLRIYGPCIFAELCEVRSALEQDMREVRVQFCSATCCQCSHSAMQVSASLSANL